jgi:hypothetical protein
MMDVPVNARDGARPPSSGTRGAATMVMAHRVVTVRGPVWRAPSRVKVGEKTRRRAAMLKRYPPRLLYRVMGSEKRTDGA